MKKISGHFYRYEFACRCGCGLNTVDVELIQLLEAIRLNFGEKPITIHSGHRCQRHNVKIGGSPKSQHLLGKAADIVIAGVSPKEVAEYVSAVHQNEFGVGVYASFTHVDVRQNKVRW